MQSPTKSFQTANRFKSSTKSHSIQAIQARQARKRQREYRITILAGIFLGVIITTVTFLALFNHRDDAAATKKQLEQITANVTLRETDLNSELVEQKTEPAETDIYWTFASMDLLDVNLHRLKSLNQETRGWLQVSGTDINYPFVQHADNDFYLKHSFDGTRNLDGWLFLDTASNPDLKGRHNLLYAHGDAENPLFEDFRSILSNGWLSNREHFVIRTSTEGGNAIWQVFSAYHIPDTADYLKLDFGNDDEFKQFLQRITRRSAYNFNAAPNTADRILTLSARYTADEVIVMHAKLLKYN